VRQRLKQLNRALYQLGDGESPPSSATERPPLLLDDEELLELTAGTDELVLDAPSRFELL
jgi:hypothetical protein